MNKVRRAKSVISKALKRWNCGVACSFGKDSIVVLDLVRQQDPNLPVLFVDTHVKFKETYEFVDRMRKEWSLNLHRTKAPPWEKSLWERDKAGCCYRLKVEPFNKLVSELDIEAVFVGIRRDEHPARAEASYFDRLGGVTHIERIEFDHWRVHPLLDWRESDVWSYIRDQGLPYNPLYDNGYRSIGCEPCTQPSSGTERSGREQDKELVLDRLRRLGYF
jgi:phosphoadenosine phosphosulfate reductase